MHAYSCACDVKRLRCVMDGVHVASGAERRVMDDVNVASGAERRVMDDVNVASDAERCAVHMACVLKSWMVRM